MLGVGCRIQGSGIRDQGSNIKIGLGMMYQGSDILGLWFSVEGFGIRD